MRRLTAKEYAAQFGLSPRTVRFKLQRQELPGGKELDPVTGIPTWYVILADHSERTAGHPEGIAGQVVSTADHSEIFANHPATTRLANDGGLVTEGLATPWEYLERIQKEHHLVVERLHRENLELAGRCGFLQAKLQEAQEEIRMLKAPTEPSNRATQRQNGQDLGSQGQTGPIAAPIVNSAANDQEVSPGGAFKRFWRWLTQPL